MEYFVSNCGVAPNLEWLKVDASVNTAHIKWRAADSIQAYLVDFVYSALDDRQDRRIQISPTGHDGEIWLSGLKPNQQYTLTAKSVLASTNKCNFQTSSIPISTAFHTKYETHHEPYRLMFHEYVLIIIVLFLWSLVLRYFFKTYSRVTFVNDRQYGSYARRLSEYERMEVEKEEKKSIRHNIAPNLDQRRKTSAPMPAAGPLANSDLETPCISMADAAIALMTSQHSQVSNPSTEKDSSLAFGRLSINQESLIARSNIESRKEGDSEMSKNAKEWNSEGALNNETTNMSELIDFKQDNNNQLEYTNRQTKFNRAKPTNLDEIIENRIESQNTIDSNIDNGKELDAESKKSTSRQSNSSFPLNTKNMNMASILPLMAQQRARTDSEASSTSKQTSQLGNNRPYLPHSEVHKRKISALLLGKASVDIRRYSVDPPPKMKSSSSLRLRLSEIGKQTATALVQYNGQSSQTKLNEQQELVTQPLIYTVNETELRQTSPSKQIAIPHKGAIIRKTNNRSMPPRILSTASDKYTKMESLIEQEVEEARLPTTEQLAQELNSAPSVTIASDCQLVDIDDSTTVIPPIVKGTGQLAPPVSVRNVDVKGAYLHVSKAMESSTSSSEQSYTTALEFLRKKQ